MLISTLIPLEILVNLQEHLNMVKNFMLFEFYKTKAHICTGNTQQQKNTDLLSSALYPLAHVS